MQFPNDGVAGRPDFASNLAARKPGVEVVLQQLDALGRPPLVNRAHVDGLTV